MAAISGLDRKTPGSTWITKYMDKLWPVVIVDADTAPPVFLKTPGGIGQNLPAVLLGRHKYVWVDPRQLKEWIPSRDYLESLAPFEENDVQANDSPEVQMEKQRRSGFRLDVCFLQDHKFWHNYMINQSEARKLEDERRNKGKLSSKPTRQSGAAPRAPLKLQQRPYLLPSSRKSYAPATSQNDRPSVSKGRRFAPKVDNYGGVWQPSTRARSSRKSKDDDDDCMIVDGSASSFPFTGTKLAGRGKHRQSSPPEESPIAKKLSRKKGRNPMIINIASDPESDSEPLEESPVTKKASRRTSQAAPSTINIVSDPESTSEELVETATSFSKSQSSSEQGSTSKKMVRLVFSDDDPTTNITIPKPSLARCKYLRDRSTFNPQHNCYEVLLWTDSRAIERHLTSDEMERLVPYFETEDIGPVYRNNKDDPHPFGRLGSTLKDEYAELLGQAFVTASKISHIELQELILDKLTRLGTLPSLSVITMAMSFVLLPEPETEAEENFAVLIVWHLAENYHKLMKEHPQLFKRLLAENADLNKAVMKKLEKSAREEKDGDQVEVVSARNTRVKRWA